MQLHRDPHLVRCALMMQTAAGWSHFTEDLWDMRPEQIPQWLADWGFEMTGPLVDGAAPIVVRYATASHPLGTMKMREGRGSHE